ncbi:MAG TPA: MFS transporter, partial [Polyangiaceae bacterium]|nr:MFS transporter [Polyangiaceae bacterium]
MSIVEHSAAFRARRFLNWFPLGLAYAFLYMGRYNLTVAKNELGQLMTKEDFGIIFAAGTFVYAIAFLLNGPIVDRQGGRRGMLISVTGAGIANLVMAYYLRHVTSTGSADSDTLRWVFSALYGVNMYFQSYGAVAIVKVNASWFHVEERGGFSGIFGTMISSGLFFAFTVNPWILSLVKGKGPMQWVVFAAPGILLLALAVFEYFVLRDRPSQAGHADFDTGDASSGEDEKPVPTLQLLKRIFTNPIIVTVALIEFCTGVLRNGVMHWFPIYVKEVWVLPPDHMLNNGSWERPWLVGVAFVVAAVSFWIASRAVEGRRGLLYVLGALAFLSPFVQGGWGGLLFIAGVIGSNVAGWVSQLFFQNRRAPAAGGLYVILTVCTVGMIFTLGAPATEVAWSDAKDTPPEKALIAGDHLKSIAGQDVSGWADVRRAVACWQPKECVASGWDATECLCASNVTTAAQGPGTIPARVVRDGKEIDIELA